MGVSASELRANIYRLLDEVLESGVPLEIERRGRTLRVTPAAPRTKLGNLPGNSSYLVGDPDDIVEMDWSREWSPDPL